MRDYATMRWVLATAAGTRSELCYDDFRRAVGQDDDRLGEELVRLADDRLLAGEVSVGDGFAERSRCRVTGLTDEGREFYKLIENDEVWRIVLGTLKKADVDVSYPLLREVCEEIVKRYVTSFIPEI